MLQAMTSHQLAEWIAYAQIEPFGDDLLDAHLAQLNANMINKDRKRGHRVDPRDFLLRKPRRPRWNPQDFFDGLRDAFRLSRGPDQADK